MSNCCRRFGYEQACISAKLLHMKIATNVHRDSFGGITISNLALFDWLRDKDDTIVGIEYVNSRHVLGAIIFRHYLPSFFSHHIINGIDITPRFSWENRVNILKKWSPLIEATKEVLRQEAPDIVLISGTYSSPWILAQAAYALGIPIVLRYAGVLQKEVLNKGFFVRRRLLAYEQWIVSSAAAVIFPSTLCRDVVEQEIIKKPVKQGIIIPNPVSYANISKEKHPRNTRYTIAAVGRWSRIKNFQAFFKLHQQLINEQWPHRAMMVTSYWDAKFDIPETIERKNKMDQVELQKFYESIDLLVVPSHFETFCNVAAEALIFGSSVLVSENVGFAEVLKKAGLERMVIPSFDDPAAVAEAVRRLAKSRLTKKERDAVARLIDPQKVHESIIHVLDQVLAGEPIE